MPARKTGNKTGVTPVDYPGLLPEERLSLFHSGNECRAYEYMGAHPAQRDEEKGFLFRVWAPAARAVSVVGDFNGWLGTPMESTQGIWQCFIPNVWEGAAYRYSITGADGIVREKADPYAFAAEIPPRTASLISANRPYSWTDRDWIEAKAEPYPRPLNIYEVHLASWRRGDGGRVLSYGELAAQLIPYVKGMGYTHIELLPVMEHVQDGGWGYGSAGYFVPTGRYGNPFECMRFIDLCHKAGLGVILDWVPSRFAKDGHGLIEFDGTYCYEYQDPQKREHPVWGHRVFDYARPQVISFLLSSALFWMERYHADGLRVGALSGMLLLDYNRTENTVKNQYGGNENLEALAFLRRLNEKVFAGYPNALMIAEESSDWPMVTKPTYTGGLGFNYKWNVGWASDSLSYMSVEPQNRPSHHNKMTFSMVYSFSENYILSLSHDEMALPKRSLIERMPGSYEEKFAGLRAYLAFMMAHPGKKLSFMGTEFAQFAEWRCDSSLDWHLLNFDMHRKFQSYVRELNLFYLRQSPFWQRDDSWDGFRWIDPGDYRGSTLSFRRMDNDGHEIVCLFRFADTPDPEYRLGLPEPGQYREIFSSEESRFGGSEDETTLLTADNIPCGEMPWSVAVDLPPLSALFFKREL